MTLSLPSMENLQVAFESKVCRIFEGIRSIQPVGIADWHSICCLLSPEASLAESRSGTEVTPVN